MRVALTNAGAALLATAYAGGAKVPITGFTIGSALPAVPNVAATTVAGTVLGTYSVANMKWWQNGNNDDLALLCYIPKDDGPFMWGNIGIWSGATLFAHGVLESLSSKWVDTALVPIGDWQMVIVGLRKANIVNQLTYAGIAKEFIGVHRYADENALPPSISVESEGYLVETHSLTGVPGWATKVPGASKDHWVAIPLIKMDSDFGQIDGGTYGDGYA